MYKKTKIILHETSSNKNPIIKDQKAPRHMVYFFNSKGKYGILLYFKKEKEKSNPIS
jgi:hypothetical protein